jgi:hypothetical protein
VPPTREGAPTSAAAKVMLVLGLLLAVVLATLPLASVLSADGSRTLYQYALPNYYHFDYFYSWTFVGCYYLGSIVWLGALFSTCAAALVVFPPWLQHSRAVLKNMLKVTALVASVLIVARYFTGTQDYQVGAYATMPLTLVLLLGAFRPSKPSSGEPAYVGSRAKLTLPELATLLACVLITLIMLFLPWDRAKFSGSQVHATCYVLGRIALLAILVSGISALGTVGYWLRESFGGRRRAAVAGTATSLVCVISLGVWWKLFSDIEDTFRPLWGIFLSLAVGVLLSAAAITLAVHNFRNTPSSSA